MYFTEKELLEKQRSQFFSLHKLLKENKIEIDDFCDLLPGVFHMNRINSVELVYLDKITRERIEIEKAKVEKEGMQVFKKNP